MSLEGLNDLLVVLLSGLNKGVGFEVSPCTGRGSGWRDAPNHRTGGTKRPVEGGVSHGPLQKEKARAARPQGGEGFSGG